MFPSIGTKLFGSSAANSAHKARRSPRRLAIEGLERRELLAGGAMAATLRDLADTFAYQRVPFTNYGNSSMALVSYDAHGVAQQQSYLRFGATPKGYNIASAKLNLTLLSLTKDVPGTQLRVRIVPDAADGWIEGKGGTNRGASGSLTWNNRPADQGAEMTFTIPLGAALHKPLPISLDVTTLVNQAINANGIATFQVDAILALGKSSTVKIATREYATASFRPTLSVSLVPPNQAPTVAQGAAAASNAGGTSVGLSVLGADDGGEANLTYTWSVTSMPDGASAPTFNAIGTNAAKETTAILSQAGAYTFTVSIGDTAGLAATSTVNMRVDQRLTSLEVSPTSASVSAGATQQFTALGFDQFGTTMAGSPTVTWNAAGGTIDSSGRFTASGSGDNITVTAAAGSVSGTSKVAVRFAGVQDGSFETPALGTGRAQRAPNGSPWQFFGDAGVASSGGYINDRYGDFGFSGNAADGNQVAFLRTGWSGLLPGAISQSVYMQPGTYSISVKVRSGAPIDVYVDGTAVGWDHPDDAWDTCHLANYATATAGMHTIAFGFHPYEGDRRTLVAFLDRVEIVRISSDLRTLTAGDVSQVSGDAGTSATDTGGATGDSGRGVVGTISSVSALGSAAGILAAVGRVDGPNGVYGSGTLLEYGENKYVLTAWHVVKDFSPSQVTFGLQPDPNSLGTMTGAVLPYRVVKFHRLPYMDHDEDVVLLELENKVTNVQGARLIVSTPAVNTVVQVIGYGRSNDGGRGVRLYGATAIDKVEKADGSVQVPEIGPIWGEQIRYRYDSGEASSAPGDSGGPDMIIRNEWGRYIPYIVGVHSYWSAKTADETIPAVGEWTTSVSVAPIQGAIINAIDNANYKPTFVATVYFDTLNVIDDGDGWLAGTGEWNFRMKVNGEERKWDNSSTDEKTYNLGHSISVNIRSGDTLNVSTYGWEDDDGIIIFGTGEDDNIPLYTESFKILAAGSFARKGYARGDCTYEVAYHVIVKPWS